MIFRKNGAMRILQVLALIVWMLGVVHNSRVSAQVPSPVVVPLHFIDMGGGKDKLGIYASIGGGTKPALFEFDTGGGGLYAAYASNHLSRSEWWGTGFVSQNASADISYDSGITYNGTVVSAAVSLYQDHHSTTPLLTTPASLVGQMNAISQTNPTTGAYTALWGPDGELNGGPPIEQKFYGDFGMSPKYSPGGITNLIAQMTFGPGLSAGFRVHADRHGRSAWLQIGLTAQDFADAGELQFPMIEDSTANGAVTPNAGLEYYAEQLFTATVSIKNAHHSPLVTPGVGITPDTGADTTLHNTDNSTASTEFNALIDWTNPPEDTVGDLQDHLDFSLTATNTLNQPVELFAFRTNSILDEGYVAVQNNRSSPLYYLNTGIALFYQYDVIYDLENGVIGFAPVPEPSCIALLVAALALFARMATHRPVRPADSSPEPLRSPGRSQIFSARSA